MVTKWRPNKKESIYVISDIHGQLEQLKLICDRILPLRKNKGIEDKIIFLGDYMDRRQNSHLVLDYLIDLKKKYGDKIIFLRGNHEDMFLKAIFTGAAFPSKFDFWLHNGGMQTLIGYLQRNNLPWHEPHLLPRFRAKDLIPKEHISFLQNDLKDYYETDKYIFVHGGCDPILPLAKQEKEIFWWDRSLFKFVKNIKLKNFSDNLPWEKTVVTGHNTLNGNKIPFVCDKFVMLDCSSSDVLMVMEMNSGEIFKAQAGVVRLVRVEIKEEDLRQIYLSPELDK